MELGCYVKYIVSDAPVFRKTHWGETLDFIPALATFLVRHKITL